MYASQSGHHRRPSIRRASDLWAEGIAAVLMATAFVAGGGPRGLGDLAVHLAALPVLVLALWRWRWAGANRWQKAFAAWLAAVAALIALQLLPLPTELYTLLSKRAAIVGELHTAGLDPHWWPMTLDRWATTRALLAFTVFAGFWLLASTLDDRARLRLLILALALGGAMALLGFAQAAAGPHTELRFHAFHSSTGAIGSFANRNHFAIFMGMLAIPALGLAWLAQQRRAIGPALGWGFLAVVLYLAAALSFSRAGFALSSAGLLVAAAMLWGSSDSVRRWRLPLLLVASAALVVGHYAWDGLLDRLEQDPMSDLRWQYLEYGLEVAADYLPVGSGLGSFPWVYAQAEPVEAMLHVYADRAHNDLLQVVIEAGIPGLLMVFTLLVLLGCVAMTLRSKLPSPEGRQEISEEFREFRRIFLARLGLLSASLPLIHSLVDYPLRTHSVAVAFALMTSLGFASSGQTTVTPVTK